MFIYEYDGTIEGCEKDCGLPDTIKCPECKRGFLVRRMEITGVVLNNNYTFPGVIPSYHCKCGYITYNFNELGVFPKDFKFDGHYKKFPLTDDNSEW